MECCKGRHDFLGYQRFRYLVSGILNLLLAGHVFTAQTVTVNTASSGSIPIPAGATNMEIELYGASAVGGALNGTGGGGGGGSGGLARTKLNVAGNNLQTIAYSVGAATSSSTVSSGTFSLTTMTANSGNIGGTGSSGGPGGTGGTASGGNTLNQTGNTGTAGVTSSIGGAGAPGITGDLGTGNPGGHGANTQTGGQPGLMVVKFT